MKLLLAEHFAGRYEKILYLDADVALHDTIAPIFSLDLGEFPLAAVPAGRIAAAQTEVQRQEFRSHCARLGMTEPFGYINTGVLLIDVGNWLRDQTGVRALNFVRRNRSLCALPDEDSLNAVLDGRQRELSPLWNFRAGAWSHREIRRTNSPIIIHYDGPKKPWKRFGPDRRLLEHRDGYRAYRNFVRTTPWQDWLKRQSSAADFRASLGVEFRFLGGRLRGNATGVSRSARRAFIEEFRRYCAETPFGDVEQGIVTRVVAGRLQLR